MFIVNVIRSIMSAKYEETKIAGNDHRVKEDKENKENMEIDDDFRILTQRMANMGVIWLMNVFEDD